MSDKRERKPPTSPLKELVSPRVDARLTLGTLQEEADILRAMALATVGTRHKMGTKPRLTCEQFEERTIAGQAIKVLCALTRDGLIKGDYHGPKTKQR